MDTRSKQSTKYVIGMDGGGTSTKASLYPLLANGDLEPAEKTYTVGSSNVNSNSEENIRENFKAIWQELGSSQVLAACLGVAGISTVGAKEKLSTYLQEAGFPDKLVLKGDHEIALRGAFNKGEGILLISGTGSIAFGQTKEGRLLRAGGYGYLIDDEGSAFSIGLKLLKRWIRVYDGRMESSPMMKALSDRLAQTGEPLEEVMKLAYQEPFVKSRIADLASLFSKFLSEEDPHALAIANEEVKELASLIRTVREKMSDETIPIVYAGGVLEHNEWIHHALGEEISSFAKACEVLYGIADAQRGAGLFAKEAYLCKTC